MVDAVNDDTIKVSLTQTAAWARADDYLDGTEIQSDRERQGQRDREKRRESENIVEHCKKKCILDCFQAN